MATLITEKYDQQSGIYIPVLRESVSEEISMQLIKKQAGKVPLEGFYRHNLETYFGKFTWGSLCGDMTGFIQSKM